MIFILLVTLILLFYEPFVTGKFLRYQVIWQIWHFDASSLL
ncbi:hypothetical protein RA11412_2258 [Rothia aeria]|uniref:Uncharacterized protein n=1 Tax=Rothia aeria TaxID=172042 RepID=A0A2Z5R1E1_9MICC|nr:hypothetical protein RA11412_2258 [Rothia aeria]